MFAQVVAVSSRSVFAKFQIIILYSGNSPSSDLFLAMSAKISSGFGSFGSELESDEFCIWWCCVVVCWACDGAIGWFWNEFIIDNGWRCDKFISFNVAFAQIDIFITTKILWNSVFIHRNFFHNSCNDFLWSLRGHDRKRALGEFSSLLFMQILLPPLQSDI